MYIKIVTVPCIVKSSGIKTLAKALLKERNYISKKAIAITLAVLVILIISWPEKVASDVEKPELAENIYKKAFVIEKKELPPFPQGSAKPEYKEKKKPIAVNQEKGVSKTYSIQDRYAEVLKNKKEAIKLAEELNKEMFGAGHWKSLLSLVSKESGWQVGRVNESSYACGIGQSLPCSKTYGIMPETVWIKTPYGPKLFLNDPDVKKEVTWTLKYIKSRYGNPTNAFKEWQTKGWY